MDTGPFDCAKPEHRAAADPLQTALTPLRRLG